MTGVDCRDWARLLKERDAPGGEQPRRWILAKSHFRGCARCRSAALRIDPSLVFTLLGDVELPESEADEMKRRVEAARRSLTVERAVPSRRWLRLGVAASVLIPALLALPNSPRRTIDPAANGTATGVAADAPSAAISAELALMPVLEVEDAPVRMFHWSGDGLALVLVVDERLDV